MPVVNPNKSTKHVLVLRPTHQAQNLIQSLTKINCIPYHFPTIEIVPVPFDLHKVDSHKLDSHDWLLWTSVNSVAHTPDWVFENQNKTAIAIGTSTAEALKARGLTNIIAPSKGANSELLVDFLNKNFKLQHKKVLIFKGVGGRNVLKGLLSKAGAITNQFDVYARALPSNPNLDIIDQWLRAPSKVCWVTSCGAFDNLLTLIPSYQYNNVLNAKIFCASHRIQKYVIQRGGTDTFCTHSPHDKDFSYTLSEIPSILVD